jgi:aldehyde:ferredoxin oxidoreductase
MAFAAKHGNNVMRRAINSRILGDPPQGAGPHEGFKIDIETLNREWAEEAGWDPESGKPSRAKLESLGLTDVADALGV